MKTKSTGNTRKKVRRLHTTSKSSSSGGILYQSKDNLFEVFVNFNSAKRIFCQSFICLILEILPLILMILNGTKDIFLWDSRVSGNYNKWVRYLYLPLDPMFVNHGEIIYLIIYITTCVFVSLNIAGFFYILSTKTSNDFLMMYYLYFFRLMRTAFLYPCLHVLLSPLRCYFLDMSFEVYMFESSHKCYNFPFLLFIIVSTILSFFILMIGTCDCIFLLDKYKGIHLWTSSPDGRLNLMIFLLQFFGIFFSVVTAPLELEVLGVLQNVFLFVYSLVLLLLIIRFVPWFHFQYVFLVSTSLLFYATIKLTSFVTISSKTYYSNVILLFFFLTLPLLWAILLMRYCLLLWFFGKRIRSNLLLCYFGIDIAIGIFVRQQFIAVKHYCSKISLCGLFGRCWGGQKKKRIHGRSSGKNYVYSPPGGGGMMAQATSVKMIQIIQTLLDDEDFEKTKTLCSHLITLTIDKNPLLAKAVINHTRTIMQSSIFLDVELSLEFYKLKITNLQELGNVTDSKIRKKKRNKFKMMTDLNRSRKREDNLSKLIRMLLFKLNSEDRKVSFSSFPQILTSIQTNMEFCESIYKKLCKIFPNAITYRRYASYMMKFTGDRKRAKMYLKEANALEFNETKGSFSPEKNFNRRLVERDIDFRTPTKTKISREHPLRSGPSSHPPAFPQGDGTSTNNSTVGSANNTDNSRQDGVSDDDDENCDSENSEVGSTEQEEEEGGGEQEEEDNDNVYPQFNSRNSSSVRSNDTEEVIQILEKPNSLASHGSERSVRITSALSATEEYHRTMEQLSEKFTYSSGNGSDWTKSNLGDDQSHVKKVKSKKYLSTIFIQCLCITKLCYVVLGILAVFILSFLLSSNFMKSAEIIQVTSDTSKAVSEVFHFLRKLQVSYYDEEMTPFDFERNTDAFRSNLQDHCDKVLFRAKWLYDQMTNLQRKPFNDIHLELKTQIVDINEDDMKENTYGTTVLSLIDAVLVYGDMCSKILELDENTWTFNHTTHEAVDGGRLQDETPFFFIRLNEPDIVSGLEHLNEELITTESNTAKLFMTFYILVPSLILLFMCLNCLSCIWFQYQQRRSFRGLMLIPSEELQRLCHVFGDETKIEQLEHQKQRRVSVSMDRNKNDDNHCSRAVSSHHGDDDDDNGLSGSSSSHIRVDTVRFSLIQQFFFYSCCISIFAFVVFGIFALVGSLTCNMFSVRNREYSETLHLEGEGIRIHLWTVEVLYRNDSLFHDETVVENLKRETKSMTDTYESLRFGNKERGLPGNDRDKTAYDIYYHDSCDTSDPKKSEFDRLECHSMNNKVDSLRRMANEIVMSRKNVSELRGSNAYRQIIMIDNMNNGSLIDTGAIMQNFLDLKYYTEHKVDTYISNLRNFSLLLLILYLPVFITVYILLFRSFSRRLNRNLSMPKCIMLLMKKEILLSRNVYEHLTGKTSFSKVFQREKTNRLEATFDILEMSSYGFICFDGDFNIIHYNTTSDELFRIKACEAINLRRIMGRESIQKIVRWICQKERTSFNGELVAIYEDQEYPVLCDISRSKIHSNKYIGVFENLESTKKKDFLKESERRTEHIDLLLRNILPKEIAEVTKMEDFKNPRCRYFSYKRATAIFMDITDFTGISQKTSPETMINLLHSLYSRIDILCEHHKLEKIKTIGDCYFCVSGIPTYKPLHAVSAMDFSIDVLKMLHRFNGNDNPLEDYLFQLRVGISSGKLVAGIIGRTKRQFDIWGPMINEAARMETRGIPGKIQVSRGTYESIFDRFEFMERRIQLQGIGASVLAYVHTPANLDDDSSVLAILKEAEIFGGGLEVTPIDNNKNNEAAPIGGKEGETVGEAVVLSGVCRNNNSNDGDKSTVMEMESPDKKKENDTKMKHTEQQQENEFLPSSICSGVYVTPKKNDTMRKQQQQQQRSEEEETESVTSSVCSGLYRTPMTSMMSIRNNRRKESIDVDLRDNNMKESELCVSPPSFKKRGSEDRRKKSRSQNITEEEIICDDVVKKKKNTICGTVQNFDILEEVDETSTEEEEGNDGDDKLILIGDSIRQSRGASLQTKMSEKEGGKRNEQIGKYISVDSFSSDGIKSGEAGEYQRIESPLEEKKN